MKIRPREWVLPSLARFGWLFAAAVLAIGTGAGGSALMHPARIDAYVANDLVAHERDEMLAWIGLAALGLAVATGGATLWERRVRGGVRVLEVGARTTRLLFGLCALLPLAYLNARSLTAPVTFAVAALTAAIAGVWFAALLDPAPAQSPPVRSDLPQRDLATEAPAGSRWAATAGLCGVLLLWLAYGWFFSRLSITNHHALNTRTTDLGLYDNIFYQSIHGDFLGCSFIKTGYHGSAHFDPILVLLSPLYLFHPRAEFLLVLQSVWLGSAVIPLYFLTVRTLGSRVAGLALGLVFILYPALHGANMYEFHSLVLVTPLVPWLLYSFEVGSRIGYAISLAALLLCREDVALLMCFVGAYVALTRRPGALLQGALTIAVSLAYFAIVKTFFMTSSNLFMSGRDAYSFAYYYEALIPKGTGLRGLATSLVTNPIFALAQVFTEEKLLFIALMFGPLAFVPFFAHPGRAMLVYGLAFCLLATKPPVYSIHFQYSTILFPIAFALTPFGLRALALRRPESTRRRWVGAMLAAMLGASVVISWKFGAILENDSFRAGFHRVTRTLNESHVQTYAWVRSMTEIIPEEASIAVTPRLGPHVSNRRAAFNLRGEPKTDYVFLNERELEKNQRKMVKELLRSGRYVRVGQHGPRMLLRKAGATER